MLSVSKTTVDRLIRSGQLPRYKFLTAVRIRESDVLALIEKSRSGATPAKERADKPVRRRRRHGAFATPS